MLKKFLLIFIVILFCGCHKKNIEEINTVIEENKNIVVGINYPSTGYNNLDNLIKKDIEHIYNDFKDNYESFSNLTNKSELNIDYNFNKVYNNIIAINLYIYINSSKLKEKIEYIKTYNYNISKKSIILLKDLLQKKELNKLPKYINNYLIKNYKSFINISDINNIKYNYNLFSIDNDYLYIYFNPKDVFKNYNDIIEIMIPLNKLNIKFNENNTYYEKANIPVNNIININKKVVALTFDDGPSKYTNELIDVLKDNDAVATFFVIGNKVSIYNKTLKKAITNGNEIGNHSYNHKWLTRVDDVELNSQINKTQNIIYETLGYKPLNFRPTYGSINNNMRKKINLNIILWNVDTMDWKYKSVDRIVKRATKNTKDLDIILMHDTRKRTVDAVKKIIPILKEQGYTFVTISELQEIKKLRNSNE